MSLNTISMPAQLVADLYHTTLIEGSIQTPPSKKKISYLGKNEKNILILVNHPSLPSLPDNELSFLTTVLDACHLNPSHVAIVNWPEAEEQDDTVLYQLAPKEILFLDVAPDVIGFASATPEYTIQKKGELQFIHAPSLSEIEKTKQAKSRLWTALKQLFCL